MLQRQALWVPTVRHCPGFVEAFHRFLAGNPFTSANVAALRLRPEESFVVLDQPSLPSTTRAAVRLAFSFIVPRESGEAVSSAADRPRMSLGLATAVCDSCNSLHVMERLLPAFPAHVSVNIQCHTVRPIEVGERVTVVSTIDKLGKRLVYCKADFYVDRDVSPEVEARERAMTSSEDLSLALSTYEHVLTAAHVKSVVAAK